VLEDERSNDCMANILTVPLARYLYSNSSPFLVTSSGLLCRAHNDRAGPVMSRQNDSVNDRVDELAT
jgi:hypothetical protein